MNITQTRCGADKGQAVPLMTLVLLTTLTLLLAVARVAPLVDDAARARTAADAAALAGAAEGRAGADRFARSNGGTLVSYEESGSTVTVEVVVGNASAAARAAASVVWLPGDDGD